MGRFPVSGSKEEELLARMAALGIYENDVVETFTHAGGHGGQNVNKVSTCVVLVHGPSGVRVRCQSERSQGLNRYLARRILADKIETLRKGEQSAEQQRIEKIRRQKRRRSRRAKLKMLANKHHRSDTKTRRQSIQAHSNWD